MKQIKQKSLMFQKAIRRQSLQNYFKTKRLVMIQERQLKNFMQQEKKVLVQIYHQIQHKINLKQNLIIIINILASQNPFKKFWRQNISPSKKQIDNFNKNLITLLLSETLPYFNKDQSLRIYCLNAVTNLLADKNCSKQQNLQFILQIIGSIYGSMQQWGYNKQMEEMSFLIANCFEQQLYRMDHSILQKLLGWAEQVLFFADNACIGHLLKGLNTFFNQIDQVYGKNKVQYFTEHLKNNRMLLVQRSIKRISVDLNRHSLEVLFKFLTKNIKYCALVLLYQQNLTIVLLENVVSFFGQTSQKSQILSINFLLQILRYFKYPQLKIKQPADSQLIQKIQSINNSIQKMKIYLIKKHFSKILRLISWESVSSKVRLLKLIRQIMYFPSKKQNQIVYCPKNNQAQIYEYLIKEGLQSILVSLITQIQFTELWSVIIQIYHLLVLGANGVLGQKLKKTFERIVYQKDNNTVLDQQIENSVRTHEYLLKKL